MLGLDGQIQGDDGALTEPGNDRPRTAHTIAFSLSIDESFDLRASGLGPCGKFFQRCARDRKPSPCATAHVLEPVRGHKGRIRKPRLPRAGKLDHVPAVSPM